MKRATLQKHNVHFHKFYYQKTAKHVLVSLPSILVGKKYTQSKIAANVPKRESFITLLSSLYPLYAKNAKDKAHIIPPKHHERSYGNMQKYWIEFHCNHR
ncbi:MAG: hypothetical protein IPJ13_17845 [Saprospiraceae bacterium]|nr:hypothetical protein [Saprospiraceae bacterium]